MVKLLLKRGASMEGKDLLGATPFQISIFRNKPDIANLLLDAGCNLNLKTINKELEEMLKINLEKFELLRKVIALHER
jgi:ankyrin repeat protein